MEHYRVIIKAPNQPPEIVSIMDSPNVIKTVVGGSVYVSVLDLFGVTLYYNDEATDLTQKLNFILPDGTRRKICGTVVIAKTSNGKRVDLDDDDVSAYRQWIKDRVTETKRIISAAMPIEV